MNRYKKIIILLILFACAFGASDAYAFWIWTPETKRWINPKYSPKENSQLQLIVVQENFDKGQYPIALREAQKLVSYFPRSREAAEGQYYVGQCFEKLNKPYDAYKAYQRAIEKYPFSERILEMVELQYKIGDAFLEGKAIQSWTNVLSGEEPPIDIFKSVIDNSPYSKFASASQYKLGLGLINFKRFYEARDAFQKVIDDYPQSEWVEPARYQIAVVTAKLSGGVAYDQGSSASARQQFEEFVKTHPDAQLSQEAKDKITKLKQGEAESQFQAAVFYEKQDAYESARIYYQNVIDNYPDTIWAAKAKGRLLKMEKKK
jgi:outer membrane protein assembly factor BamD